MGIVAVLTLWELIQGGVDTKALVTASKQQANAASDQADAAQQFSDTAEDINGRMSDAVDQLSAAASNARAGIKATQDAMRLEQRAWVAASGIVGTPAAGQQFIVQFMAVNSGRTFAKHFAMVSTVEIAKPGTKLFFDKTEGASYNSVSILSPNAVYTAKSTVTGEGSSPVLPNPTQSDIDKIKTGEIEISAFGRMDYIDIFKVPHWSVFCYRLQRDLSWASCDEHNDADENQPKSGK